MTGTRIELLLVATGMSLFSMSIAALILTLNHSQILSREKMRLAFTIQVLSPIDQLCISGTEGVNVLTELSLKFSNTNVNGFTSGLDFKTIVSGHEITSYRYTINNQILIC
jgi:hypothetical protein